MAQITTTTQQEFDQKVLQATRPVLVDFWAEWCPPCRMMEPVLLKIAKDLDGKADIVKVNVEESADNMQLAGKYGVQGIPNMQVFKGGKVVHEFVGLQPERTIADKLQSLL